ncbi:HAD-IB family hydrolase [Streptomyces calidiresistens]|uniref:HAD-IB family hydrolase n=1 Tax=Streptomyces calidiresistens TaxID=1485586 RepID=A0A7W3T6Z6_9ACTN|nr:HAD family hydrolase [Streptomyces calidiresistens]MBB0232083.1 HAD-IB family hydrolase [Streptomyces calidiresistens]
MLGRVENPPRPRTAAFFDLDKTVIAKSSTLAFGRPFYRGGLMNRRAVLRTAYAQFVYLVGGSDHEQTERMRKMLSALCRGWDVQQVREIVAETLHQMIDPFVYAEAAALIAEHRAAGRDIVIVSTSGAEVVEPIGELLGADRVVATRMVVEEGRYTGEIEYYAYGPTKAEAIRELAGTRGYDLERCWAYSDSITDVPMLEAVGMPHAVNPDRALRREALAREWPILTFSRPVPLRRRMSAPPARSALAVGLAVGAAVGAALVVRWWWERERAARAGG